MFRRHMFTRNGGRVKHHLLFLHATPPCSAYNSLRLVLTPTSTAPSSCLSPSLQQQSAFLCVADAANRHVFPCKSRKTASSCGIPKHTEKKMEKKEEKIQRYIIRTYSSSGQKIITAPCEHIHRTPVPGTSECLVSGSKQEIRKKDFHKKK